MIVVELSFVHGSIFDKNYNRHLLYIQIVRFITQKILCVKMCIENKRNYRIFVFWFNRTGSLIINIIN